MQETTLQSEEFLNEQVLALTSTSRSIGADLAKLNGAVAKLLYKVLSPLQVNPALQKLKSDIIQAGDQIGVTIVALRGLLDQAATDGNTQLQTALQSLLNVYNETNRTLVKIWTEVTNLENFLADQATD